jgi:hypothetical protein
MPDLHSLLRPPYFFLIVGIISFCMGIVSTCTGVTWARFGHVIYRDKEPKEFWQDVVASYVIGVFFIAYYFYKDY